MATTSTSSSSTDPAEHQRREREFVAHVQRLLGDERLRLDTTRGRRPVTTLNPKSSESDHAVDLKRLMSEMKRPDRELESRMPVGTMLDVELKQKGWFFSKTVGRLLGVCVSPSRALLAGESPKPLTTVEVQKILTSLPPAPRGVPTTVAICSTSGFSLEAHELAERRAERAVILVAPNDAGGWSVSGPAETKALTDLFDPEAEAEKRQRLRKAIEAGQSDLTGAGLAADKLAARTQLPTQLVEAELKSYAKETAGLAAKRLDGRVVLFREGSLPNASSVSSSSSSKGSSVAAGMGGSLMPVVDRIRSLFSLKGETQKKIAFLSERRAALSQQRDRAYDEMGSLEKQESTLRQQFKEATGAITKRRVTSQLLQLHKDVERRQQLLAVLNQQINVVSTHLHNLELVQQGKTAKLPDSEEMATDAAAAEEMLATLQADSELADSVGTVAHAGMSAEEQALYEELERESGGEESTAPGTKIKLDTVEEADESPTRSPNAPTSPRRAEPEAG